MNKQLSIAAIAALGTLNACDELAYPAYAKVTADIPQLTEDMCEIVDGAYEIVKATEVIQAADLWAQLPETVQELADVQVVEFTIESPRVGNLGEWAESFEVYLSSDDTLSEDDVLVQTLTDIDPNRSSFVVSPEQDILLSAIDGYDTMALIVKARFHTLPQGELHVPIRIYAEGRVAITQ